MFPDFETTLAFKRKQYADQTISFYKKARLVPITATDEKTLTDSSVKGIIRDSRLKDFTPDKLHVEINDITNKFILDVGRSMFDGKLSYNVDCFDQKCKDEIVFDIDNWIDKHKPSKPRQIWNSTWLFFVIMGFMWSILLLPSIFTFQSYDYKPLYKTELNTILKSGINKDNQVKAQELFIKYNMDYLPEDVRDKQTIKIDYLWLRVAVVVFLIALASVFRPRTTIGIGRHKGVVERYNTYIKLAFVTIPSSIILPPLYLFVRKLLGM